MGRDIAIMIAHHPKNHEDPPRIIPELVLLVAVLQAMSSMEKGNREISDLPPYEEEALFNGRYVSYSATSHSVNNNTPSLYQEKQQSKFERVRAA